MQSPLGEPMALGSPQPPASPGQHQYLPAYLMGEPPSMVASPPSARRFSGGAGSPPRNSVHRVSWCPSPTMSQTLLAGQSPRTEPRTGGRKEKTGAPPVQGLLESIHTPSSGRKNMQNLDTSHNTSVRQSFTPGQYTPTLHGQYTPNLPGQFTPNLHGQFTPNVHGIQTPGQIATPIGIPKKTPPSPAQRDPFYTQGENLRSDDELDETWVTVFGFPPAATSYILQQFSQYGTIMKHVIASDGNWMHIQFQSKFQAKKALSKNGRVFGGSIMVGVTPCIDKSIMLADEKENLNLSSFRTSFIGTPTQNSSFQQSVLDKGSNSRNTPIRPLTAAYKVAVSDHEVVAKSNTPQKNSGFLSKTMEYVFGL